jgi:hypothetical protein
MNNSIGSISDVHKADASPVKPVESKPVIMKKNARTTILELTTELRHKYLTILKSCYWEFFEEG